MPGRSVHYDLLDAVRGEVVACGLYGISPEHVILQAMPTDQSRYVEMLPCVLVAPGSAETISRTEGTAQKDDIVYPCIVALIDAANQESQRGIGQPRGVEQWLDWREKVVDRLIHNRMTNLSLATGAALLDTWIEPGSILEPGWLQSNLAVSVVTLMCLVRKQRRL